MVPAHGVRGSLSSSVDNTYFLEESAHQCCASQARRVVGEGLQHATTPRGAPDST